MSIASSTGTSVGAGPAQAPPPPPPLPALRPELRLLQGAASVTGEPTWLIHDPLLNRFIQIDPASYETLRRWPECASEPELIAKVNAGGRVALDDASLKRFVSFLYGNNLTMEAQRNGWRHYAALRENGRHSPLAWLVHNYLFFRLPLCRPQAFLERTLPFADAVTSRFALAFLAVLGAVGLYLATRQWDQYLGTLQGFFTWEGVALAALGLGCVKAAHELGHAYTAVRHGCRVHTMGLAFIVMAPLLYTDVTDSWRLRDRRQRIAIDSAGIKVELGIAAVALFLWAFLPEGPLRSLAFVLSAVSVVSSLLINLNPFMRFDGYYLLSETLGVENLQARAFALGRWKLREWLFGLGEAAPEEHPRWLSAVLIVYAWSVWIYRLVLFVGIALLVYHYFFKVLGLILFAVEIIFFVARPIWSELRCWWERRGDMAASARARLTLGAVACLGLLAVVPWSSSVEIPAVVESGALTRIYPLRPARVAQIHVTHGAEVVAGQPLVTLTSPDIAQDIDLSVTKLRLAQLQHARRGADRSDLEDTVVLESTIASLKSRIEGLKREQAELVLRAPFSGRIAELNPMLHAGRWVNVREMVALIAAPGTVVARGYIAEPDMWRLQAGARGRFIPEFAQRRAIDVTISQIATASSSEIEIADLASQFSGRIAVTADPKRRLNPVSAQYMVHMKAGADVAATEVAVRGVVVASGQPESFVARAWRQTLKVLMRESGA